MPTTRPASVSVRKMSSSNFEKPVRTFMRPSASGGFARARRALTDFFIDHKRSRFKNAAGVGRKARHGAVSVGFGRPTQIFIQVCLTTFKPVVLPGGTQRSLLRLPLRLS